MVPGRAKPARFALLSLAARAALAALADPLDVDPAPVLAVLADLDVDQGGQPTGGGALEGRPQLIGRNHQTLDSSVPGIEYRIEPTGPPQPQWGEQACPPAIVRAIWRQGSNLTNQTSADRFKSSPVAQPPNVSKRTSIPQAKRWTQIFQAEPDDPSAPK